ncbi:MAG: hypothetical protein ABEL51_16650 [Salinibacter sp.]
MTQSIAAAVHICESTIRFAALAREDDTLSLQRFGQRTFEFDVARALWEDDAVPDGLDRVKGATRDVFDGVELTSLRIVLHPLDVYSFFIPVPADLSAQERKRHATPQAALVTGARSPDTLRLTLRPVRTVEQGGEAIEWVHVLAVPRDVDERMEALLGVLPVQHTARLVSSEAAARLLGHAETGAPVETENPFRLGIGAYPSHTEYALTYDRSWYHAHATQDARTAADRAYYAVGVLNRVQVPPSAISSLFVYGPDANSDALEVYESVFECRPVPLNPFEHLAQLSERPQDTHAPGLHVPCIGAALDAST